MALSVELLQKFDKTYSIVWGFYGFCYNNPALRD